MTEQVYIETENHIKVNDACDEVENPRSRIGPSIIAASGPAGVGKTTAFIRRAVNTNAIYLPPLNKRSPLMLLREITFELCRVKPGRIEGCCDVIGSEMAKERRLVIIDEADLLPMGVLEMVRNLNERFSFPLVLIGENDLIARLTSRRRLLSRIRRRVEFGPVSQADIVLFFQKALGLAISSNVAVIVQRHAKGDWRPVITVCISFERAIKASGINEVSESLAQEICSNGNG